MLAQSLSDIELTEGLKKFVQDERQGTLGVVELLGQVEERQLHLIEGYGSLYSYVVVELGYSESAAMRRIVAARCARKFPRTFTLLKKGLLNLSTISLIAPVLNEASSTGAEGAVFDELTFLRRVAGQSSRRVKEIVAEYQPPRFNDFQDELSPYLLAIKDKTSEAELAKFSKRGFENYLRRDGELFEKRYRLQFGASADLIEKLEYAKQLLSGKFPRGAATAEIFEEILDQFIERNCPRQKGRKKQTDKKGLKDESGPGQNRGRVSRYIPSSLKWEVLKRDGFRCSFVGKNGKRCESCWDLEMDHYPVPYARGGKTTLNNLRALCSAHNQLSASQQYGREFMQGKVA